MDACGWRAVRTEALVITTRVSIERKKIYRQEKWIQLNYEPTQPHPTRHATQADQ